LLPEYLRGLVRPIHGGNRDGEHLEPLTRLRRAVEVGKMAFDGARDEWLKYLLYLKYQIRPLPDNRRELEELASSLRVSLAYTYRHHGLDTEVAQTRIRKTLAAFRSRGVLVLALMLASAVAVRYLE
jgi:hypothetical protein